MIMHASEMPESCGIFDSTEEFFGENSPLIDAIKHGGPKYEVRPQQVEMAHRVATAFEEKHNLCIEAPTGGGKSFAYLIPAIYFSQNNDYPVIISTETISLQEQLIAKDIPLVSKNTLVKDALLEMTSKRLGITGVLDKNKKLNVVILFGSPASVIIL